MKSIKSKKEFEKKMTWAKQYSQQQLRMIGAAEILGAVGVSLPLWLGIAEFLTPLAAIGLIIVTLFALRLHASRKENGSIIFVLFNTSLLVYILWQTYPILLG